MDLQQAFSAWGPSDPDYNDRLERMMRRPGPGHHPLVKLRRALRWNLVFALAGTLGLGAFMLSQRPGIVMALLLVVLAFCLWALWDGVRLLRDLGDVVSSARPVLAEIRRHHDTIQRAIRLHERVALYVYPFAATAGFVAGGMAGSGKDAALLMQKPIMWVILAVTLALLIPFFHLLARRTNRALFGVHLAALKASITELEGNLEPT